MSRIRSDEAQASLERRARIVPAASTIAASALALLPVVASEPVLPPTGLLMLLAWRLLRPELWPAWVALPLGLADDLLTGAPIGSGPVLWTGCLLLLDQADNRLMWRDYRQEWLLAALLLAGCLFGELGIARLTGAAAHLGSVAPQFGLALAAFPAFMRVAATLDAWRLGR